MELLTMAMLIGGAFLPVLSVIGAAMGTGTFVLAWSFLCTMPLASLPPRLLPPVIR